jgi:hypothetical protein
LSWRSGAVTCRPRSARRTNRCAPAGATVAVAHGHPGQHSGSYVTATVLALAALTLGGIQLAIDGQYAGGFGRTPVETALQAVQGVAIGLAAMILPSVAAVLRRAGHGAWSRMAWLIWPGFLVLTILAGMGFSAGGLSDTLAGRAASIEQAQSAREQRAQAIATAQRAADTATEARKAECAPRGPRCRDREADERSSGELSLRRCQQSLRRRRPNERVVIHRTLVISILARCGRMVYCLRCTDELYREWRT